ncbi:hypothetical protein AKO1_008300 [Acrasis kona]|uniref:Uncharacterized protein n=1 Tax=Acrasis kona TaxID=1008807 RepID=A0AAW2YMR2_9EUKA
MPPIIDYEKWHTMCSQESGYKLTFKAFSHLIMRSYVPGIPENTLRKLIFTFDRLQDEEVNYSTYSKIHGFFETISECYTLYTMNTERRLFYWEAKNVLENTQLFKKAFESNLAENQEFIQLDSKKHYKGFLSFNELFQVAIGLKYYQDKATDIKK